MGRTNHDRFDSRLLVFESVNAPGLLNFLICQRYGQSWLVFMLFATEQAVMTVSEVFATGQFDPPVSYYILACAWPYTLCFVLKCLMQAVSEVTSLNTAKLAESLQSVKSALLSVFLVQLLVAGVGHFELQAIHGALLTPCCRL